MRATLGTTYLSLGLLAEAEGEIRRALELRREALGENHPDYAQSAFDLAVLLRLTGAELTEPEELYREALRICRDNRDCRPDLLPASMIELGYFMASKGESEPGKALLDEPSP